MSRDRLTDLDPTSFDDLRVLSNDCVADVLAGAPEHIAKRIQVVGEQRIQCRGSEGKDGGCSIAHRKGVEGNLKAHCLARQRAGSGG